MDAFLLGAGAAVFLTGARLAGNGQGADSGPDERVGVQSPGAPRGGSTEGRSATTPSEIPARGWWAIVKRTGADVSENALMTQAAAVTFYGLLALFPAIAALVSLYGLFADPSTIKNNLSLISDILPGGGMQIITDQVNSLTSKPPAALGFGIVVGLATSLWSANAAVKAMFDALNAVYEEKEKRSFLRRTLISLACTFGGIAFLILALAAVVVLPAVLGFLGMSEVGALLVRLARWPVMLVAIAGILSVLYRYGPSRTAARWRWVTWGSAFASIAWVLVSIGFSFYVANFGSYDKTYGSLGAAIGFMTWIWLSTTVVLIGGELNAEIEHQTAHDTTIGPFKPMGSRGARQADTIP